MRPRVLMASFHDWDAPVQLGSQHLARGFVRRGWDVAFVSGALSPVQVLRDPAMFRRRLGAYRPSGSWHLDGHLWAYTPAAVVTPHNVPILRSRAVHRSWQRLTVPSVVAAVRKRGFGEVDLLYIDAPVQRFWLDVITREASVARIADRYSGFVGIADQALQLESELIRSVDLAVYSASSLAPHVASVGAHRSEHLPNGVDFAALEGGSRVLPPEYKAIPRPIAVFVGSLDRRFDCRTVDALAVAMPAVSFVLIGPDTGVGERLRARSNIHRIGVRHHRLLSRYLHNADVGLIPYDFARHPELIGGIHPLKLYEYFACGLPVVATRWPEIERLNSPAILCDRPDDFVDGVRRALDGGVDVDRGIELARNADWSGRVEDLLRMLGLSGSAGETA